MPPTYPANDTRELAVADIIQALEAMIVQLRNERSSFLEQWKEVGLFISPNRQRYFTTDTNKGNRRNRNIIDSTASTVMRTLSAGIMGGMTSPARDWSKVLPAQPMIILKPATKLWLDDVSTLIRKTMNTSNLYQCLPQLYNDVGTFATAAMMAEEDFQDVVRFYTFPIGSYMVANDDRGQVSVFVREFRMTVRQIVKKFQKSPDDWSNFSDFVKQSWANKRYDAWIDCYHVISPNENYDDKKLSSKFKKFKSCYWERSHSSNGNGGGSGAGDVSAPSTVFLRESGYDIFPVMVTRWQLAAEDVYGTDCPGMMMLGDVKQLQMGEKRIMQAIEKVINPPMKGPESMKSTAASIIAGGYTFVNESAATGKFEPVHTIDPRITEMEGKQEQLRKRIKNVGFEDVFLMMSNDARTQPPTAEEVIEKRSEKMLALGSVVQQFVQDLLNPLHEIIFNFLLRQGAIPPVPEELAGQPLKIEYFSIMAQAQKILGVANKERFAGFVIKMAMETKNPDVLDNVDFDELVQEYADSLGIEEKNLRSPDMIAQLRAGRQQAQQAMQQAQVAQQGADAAKSLSQADMSKDSALTRLLGGSQAAATPPV